MGGRKKSSLKNDGGLGLVKNMSDFWGNPPYSDHSFCFPNSNSFGVFSHSKGFGAELLSYSLWSVLGCQTVPPRFDQGPTKVSPLQVSWCLWLSGADHLGCQQVLQRVPPITALHLTPSSFNSFLHLSEQS